jgi:hypothetical protein
MPNSGSEDIPLPSPSGDVVVAASASLQEKRGNGSLKPPLLPFSMLINARHLMQSNPTDMIEEKD